MIYTFRYNEAQKHFDIVSLGDGELVGKEKHRFVAERRVGNLNRGYEFVREQKPRLRVVENASHKRELPKRFQKPCYAEAFTVLNAARYLRSKQKKHFYAFRAEEMGITTGALKRRLYEIRSYGYE